MDDSESQRFQIGIASGIMCLGFFPIVGGGAVHFHNQASLARVKVGNIPTNGMLAPKCHLQIIPAQNAPQLSFWWSHITTE